MILWFGWNFCPPLAHFQINSSNLSNSPLRVFWSSLFTFFRIQLAEKCGIERWRELRHKHRDPKTECHMSKATAHHFPEPFPLSFHITQDHAKKDDFLWVYMSDVSFLDSILTKKWLWRSHFWVFTSNPHTTTTNHLCPVLSNNWRLLLSFGQNKKQHAS